MLAPRPPAPDTVEQGVTAEGFPIAVAPTREPRPLAEPAPHAGAPAPRPRLNPLAVLALVLGLLLSPFAALFGHLAAGQITRSYGAERGLVIAWVATGLGWLWLLVLVILVGGVWVALSA